MEEHTELSKAKPEKPAKTDIKIERKEEVQELLDRAKAPKPVKEKKKETRGRPRKVKPDATLKKYQDHPLAVEIDKGICFAFNATFTKPDLMKPEDTNIGEALIYCGEYYGWKFFEHPILILIMAIGGTAWTAWQKREQAKPKAKPVKPEKEKPNGD